MHVEHQKTTSLYYATPNGLIKIKFKGGGEVKWKKENHQTKSIKYTTKKKTILFLIPHT